MPIPDSNNCPRLPDCLLLESLVTTLNADGSPHLSPMGPIVDANFSRLLLRPYQTSITFQNLQRTRQGVMHVTDDVMLFAQAAIGRLNNFPAVVSTKAVEGVVLRDACRWYEFRIVSIDDRNERAEILAETIDHGRGRDFFGFNRAKNAVIEVAILATRISFLAADHIEDELERLAASVEKTGGRQERAAFELLRQYIDEQLSFSQTCNCES